MFDPEMSVHELSENIEFLKMTGLNQHDARMTKKLRIEAGTPILEEYRNKNMIAGKLDINELIYPYTWKYNDVESIYEVFSEWEKELINEIYKIQAATRGEIADESIRNEWRSDLGKIRSIEIEVLEKLTLSSLQGIDPQSIDLGYLTEKKQNQVQNLLNKIKET